MSRYVDLTLTLRPSMRGIDWESAATVENQGWNARLLHLYSHSGTHMDSPKHFNCGEQTIDQIPLTDCISEAWVVNLTHLAPKALIEVADLGVIADQFKEGQSLLLHTGWSQHVDDADYYRSSFPRISEGLANWCVEKKVCALGVEPPSVADVFNLEEVTKIHHLLLKGQVVIVEGLTALDQLTEKSVTFVALPLKVQDGDGAPCRALAIEKGNLVDVA